MTTTVEDLERLIAAPREGECLEFKLAENGYDSTKLCKYCVGIANEGGGKLILGVTDARPRQVRGTRAINDPSDMQAKLFNKLGFRINIEQINHPHGRVVICFRRNGWQGSRAFMFSALCTEICNQ